MNKEWLVDKKEQLKSATVFINENGNEAVEVSLSVLNKLIEQAERVEELEGRKYRQDLIDEHIERLEQQNKRYKQALGHIEENSNDKVAVFIASKALQNK